MNIKEVLERIEECRKFPNRGLDSKQLTVLRYILEPLSQESEYQESECINFKGHGFDIVPGRLDIVRCIYCGKDEPIINKYPEVFDIATKKAFYAGYCLKEKITENN
jgi:hypothetical protein